MRGDRRAAARDRARVSALPRDLRLRRAVEGDRGARQPRRRRAAVGDADRHEPRARARHDVVPALAAAGRGHGGDHRAISRPRVEALAARLPALLDDAGRARVDAAVADHAGKGVPEELATRVVTLDALYSTLDIVEVAGATRRPVELVAEIYFELSTRLGLPWLREMIGRLPGDKHWQMLAKAAMHDDLSGLQRTIAARGAERRRGYRHARRAARRVAGAQSPRHRARPAAAGRTARGAGRGCRDARGRAARAAHPRLTGTR